MIRLAVASAWMLIAVPVKAEGIFHVDPFVASSVSYDDNLFRFADKKQADALGFSSSDRVRTVMVGADAKLRLSRQIFNLSASLSDNKYNKNAFLNNRAKRLNLNWNWQLGSKLYGNVSASKETSISGFDNNNERLRNNREAVTKQARLNWQFGPNWVAYGLAENVNLTNDRDSYKILNREDGVYELGVRYFSDAGNQVGVFYRHVDTVNPDRSSIAIRDFGAQSLLEQYGVDVLWSPSSKLRFRSRFSVNDFERENARQDGFSGFNQQYGLSYLASARTNLNLNAYKQASQVDDIVATYVEVSGADIGVTWDLTSKTRVNAKLDYVERAFLGNTLIKRNSDFSDKTKSASIGIQYRPIDNASLELRYLMTDRDANIQNNNFRFNNVQLSVQYQF